MEVDLSAIDNRLIALNASVGSWSSVFTLSTWSIGTNVFYQTYTQTIPLATLGIIAGQTYQFELTRNGASASDTLVGDFQLLQATVAFT